MQDPWELLLGDGSPEARVAALERALGAPEAVQRLEAALPDLLREPDEALLARAVELLTPLAADPAARRALDLLSRRPGPTRAAALRALRGPS